MTKGEFMSLVARWSAAWDEEFRRGEPGFGSETSLDDWLGSISAYTFLASLGQRLDELGVDGDESPS